MFSAWNGEHFCCVDCINTAGTGAEPSGGAGGADAEPPGDTGVGSLVDTGAEPPGGAGAEL